MSAENQNRPFKIWSHDRRLKKSVTATTLKELLEKSKKKLDLDDKHDIKIVLEEDGTEIDDEDYFGFVASNSTLMILTNDQQWNKQSIISSGNMDETDFGSGLTERSKQLILGLQKDLSRIIAFSNEDLENIISADSNDLCHLLQETECYVKALQEACQRHLDERQLSTEAIDLLRLYHQSRKSSPYVEDGNKKRKADHTS